MASDAGLALLTGLGKVRWLSLLLWLASPAFIVALIEPSFERTTQRERSSLIDLFLMIRYSGSDSCEQIETANLQSNGNL